MKINVLSYLDHTAEKYPDKIAVDDGTMVLSFLEFQHQARQIGAYIRNQCGETNRAVFVFVDRSVRPLVAFMGVLYSGNYYVPVDDKTPYVRLQQMIDKIKPVAMIQLKEGTDEVRKLCRSILFEEAASYIMSENDRVALEKARDKIIDVDPCYILFTSGSTGTPKGVVISHRAVVDLTEWLNQVTGITSKDSIGNQTPFFFDASVKDIYQMIKTGATLYVLQPQNFVFTKKLISILNEKKISVILWAASAITMVANSGILSLEQPKYLRVITFAGEQLFTKHLNQWRKACPEAVFINLYGPTETTVDCLYYIVDREFSDDEVIPLGKACRNKEVFLIDADNRIIWEGTGEICVRGTGVGLGYFDEKGKTEGVFIQNPAHDLYRDIVYKTGDLAYYNDNGEMVFASRKDYQIKHHGHRIELGEIEAALSTIAEFKEVGCVYDHEQGKILAFYTGEELPPREISLKILSRLPKMMHPEKYIYLDKMLYTRNGKIDKKGLLELYLKSRCNS